jgi:L-alanine-DL-glutamate epimerase-like enolase superfamily enzyme
VVEIHTDEELTGTGEVDTNPWVAQATIHSNGTHALGLGLEDLLLAENPLHVEALWDKMYAGSLMTGSGRCANWSRTTSSSWKPLLPLMISTGLPISTIIRR